MSKLLEKNLADLERCEAELQRKAKTHVLVIRRVVQEYNEARDKTADDSNLQLKKQREIERVIGEYTELYKTIRRLRKQMQVRIKASNPKDA